MAGRSDARPRSVRNWLWASGVAVLLGLLSVAPAGATNSWGSYHWARTSNPFSLKLVDSMTSAWDSYLGAVSGDWSSSSVLDTPVEAGSDSNDTRKKCAAPSGKVRTCNSAYGFNGWLGLAQIWVSGSHIVKASSKVNDSYFNTSTYNDPNAKRHVLCQEVGHTLGLDHQRAADSKSCMDDRNGLFDANFVSPNDHDYQQLVTIYSHTDSTSTVSASTASGARGRDDEASDDPAQWGKLVSSSGRSSLYEKDLGSGRKLFTWVFWADPGAVRGR